jgi:hypothetical protein
VYNRLPLQFSTRDVVRPEAARINLSNPISFA